MTQPSQPQPAGTPLWSNQRINECITAVLGMQPNHTPRGLTRRVAYTMRDSYENAIAERDARIAALEAQLAEAQGDAEHWHRMFLDNVDGG